MERNEMYYSSAAEVIRSLGRSTLFLVCTICYTLATALGVVEQLMPVSADSMEELQSMLEGYGINESLFGMATSVPVKIAETVITNLFPVIIIIGLWMIWVSCRKEDGGVGGFKLIYVAETILMALMCVAIIGFAVLVIIVMIAESGSEGFTAVAETIMALLIMLLPMVLIIFYYRKLRMTVRSAMTAVQSGNYGEFSKFVAFIAFIGGAFNAFSVLGGGSILVMIECAAAAAADIIFGILIFKTSDGILQAARSQDAYRNQGSYGTGYGNQGSYGNTAGYGNQGSYGNNYGESYMNPSGGYPSGNQTEQQSAENQAEQQTFESRAQNQPLKILLTSRRDGTVLTYSRSRITVGTADNVNLRISGNRNISGQHAIITLRDGRYFVIDNYSAGHTYINGRVLEPSVPTEINPGDCIAFADEEFTFEVK